MDAFHRRGVQRMLRPQQFREIAAHVPFEIRSISPGSIGRPGDRSKELRQSIGNRIGVVVRYLAAANMRL